MSGFILAKSFRFLALGAIISAGVGLAPASANAGFFDQLFGGGTPQPAQPNYGAEPQAPVSPDAGPVQTQRPFKRTVAHEVKQVRQKTTDLMHDKTLRPGDAIMMKDGVHIYNGPEAVKHSAKQFVPIDDARYVTSTQRAALVAMYTTPTTVTLQSGRSIGVVSPGYRITDARGASVRYVGP